MKFIDDRGEFDVRAFRHAVDVLITATGYRGRQFLVPDR